MAFDFNNQEEFMNRLKNRQLNVDAELDELENEMPELKAEKENKQNNKKQKKGDDNDLNLSDLEDDKEEVDPGLKAIEDELNNPDMWDDYVERIYHNVDNMKSITVLQEEEKVLDEIIKFKTLRGTEFKYYETKKRLVKAYIKKIENEVEEGTLDQEAYKKNIQDSIKVEEDSIQKAKNDSKVTNIEFLQKRIKKRIELIQAELSEEVAEAKVEEPKEPVEEKKENKIHVENLQTKEDSQAVVIKSDDIVLKERESLQSVKNNKEGIPEESPGKSDSQTNQLEKLINQRLDEYKEAVKYFKKHGFNEQEVDAEAKVDILKNAIKMLRVDQKKALKDLPEKITSAYICGYDAEERKQKFLEIIKDFQKQRQEAKDSLNAFTENLQKIGKEKVTKIKKEVAKTMQEKSKKVENIESILKKFLEFLKDEWIPVPQTEIKKQEEKVEKINEDVKENIIVITIGKTNITNNTSRILVTLNLEDMQLINENTNITGNKFTYKTILDVSKFTKSDIKTALKHHLNIELFFKSCCCFPESSQGVLIVPLTELKSKSDILTMHTFPNTNYQVEVGFRLRVPFVEKEYKVEYVDRLSIQKLYPSFKDEKKPVVVPKPEPVEEKKKPEKKQPEQQTQQPANPSTNQKISYDQSDFSCEELKDPDIIENLTSLTVIKDRLAVLEDQYKKIEGRPPKEFRDKLMKMRVQLKCLEQSMSEGVITEDAYKAKLSLSLLHDRKLEQYFKDKGDSEKEKIVQSRIKLILTELKELAS